MKRMKRCLSLVTVLCLLLGVLTVTPVMAASGYKNVYGKTLDRVRVRASGSLSATIVDNVIRGACLYILETDYASGGQTFIRVKYRDSDGDVATGWVCQHDGKSEYVRVLSKKDASSSFGVKDGALPSTRVGTMDRDSATSASTTSSNTNYLKLGSKSSAVTKLQKALKKLGFYSGDVTGHYGDLTEKAVKAYQKKVGLYVDGIAGPSTQDKIYAASGSVSSGSSSSSSSSNDTILKLDAEGSRVSTLQTNLKKLGFYSAEVTGHFGSKTKAAVVAFQRKYSLSADGIAGKKTLDKIDDLLAGGSGSSSSGSGISTTGVLKEGSQGTAVTALQQDLKELKMYSGEITGNFGPKTATAVKSFQKKYDLTADGIAGKKTLDKINAVMGGSSSSSGGSSSSSSTLRYGSEGLMVTSLQNKLTELKFYYGEITGHYGYKTVAAVKKYQKSVKITADGIAGIETLTKLGVVNGSGGSGGTGGSSVNLSSEYGVTTKDKVILRSYYTTSSKEKTRLSKGTYFKILAARKSGNYTWLQISVKNTTGYVRSDMVHVLTANEAIEYLNNQGSSGTGEHGEIIGKIIITGSTVNMRASAGTSGAYVGKAVKDQIFSYINTQSVSGVLWYQVASGSWVSGSYARKLTDSEIDNSDDSSGYYTLKEGMNDNSLVGAPILKLQTALKALDYYSGNLTGRYGSITKEAVRLFQKAKKMDADGIAGPKTQKALYGEDSGLPNDGIPSDLNITTVYNILWSSFKSNCKNAFKYEKGSTATIYDIKTKLSFKVKCQSNGLHSDVEPLTAKDTNIMMQIYGVSIVSKISYIRRPVILITGSGDGFAASIYGVAHGTSTISDNNFPGQFCVHLRGSMTHVGNKVDPDHKAAVSSAAAWAEKLSGVTVISRDEY